MGRTQLQDAVPMTLGQEFRAFATTMGEDLQRLRSLAPELLTEVNLGGTAIGTGINADPATRPWPYSAWQPSAASRWYRLPT
jgi:aspartate ammonia-lyase